MATGSMTHIVVGRLVGLGMGLTLFHGILGFLACLAGGFVFDVLYARYIFPKRHRAILMQNYTVAMIGLAAKMCKSDGVVTREEISAFRERMVVSERDLIFVSSLFNAAKASIEGFEAHAQHIATLLRNSPEQLQSIVEMLYEIALSDNYVAPGEQAFILKVAEIFGLSQRQVQDIERRLEVGARHQSTQGEGGRRTYRQEEENPFQKSAVSGKDPHKILGVGKSASKEEIKRAYRKLVAKHHPDKLAGEGAGSAEIIQAEGRMIELNAAYAILMKRL